MVGLEVVVADAPGVASKTGSSGWGSGRPSNVGVEVGATGTGLDMKLSGAAAREVTGSKRRPIS